MGLLILPNNPLFYDALENLPMPFDFDPSKCIIQRSNSLLLESVSAEEARDYGFGGEYDELEDELDNE
jgi:hypothetical protein